MANSSIGTSRPEPADRPPSTGRPGRWSSARRAVASPGNILAGVSVGSYLIPQAMAYSALAGLDAATGLTVAAVPLAAYMVLGRSKLMSVGPESTVALMTAAAVGPVAASTGMPPLTAVAATSVLVGLILLGGCLLRASFLADLLSKPILIGYLTGVAVLMLMSQLPTIVGYNVDTSSLSGLWNTQWHIPDYRTLAIVAATAGISLALRAISRRIPGPLVALIIALILGIIWDVPEVGPVSMSLPVPQLSGLSMSGVTALILPAISIAILSYTDIMINSRAFAKGVPPDPADEMRALAGVQAITGIAGGYPVSASSSRTALAAAAGATSRFYSVFVLVILLAGPLLFPGVIAAVPTAGLAGIIVFAAVTLIEPREWGRLRQFRAREAAIAGVCAASVIVLGLLPGVAIAITISVVEFIARLARPHEGILGFVPGRAGMHDIDDYERTTTIPGLVVFRYDAPLFFINAFDFYKKVTTAAEPGTSVLILNMEANVELDSTALSVMDELHRTLEKQGTQLWLARVKHDVLEPMRAHGVASVIGEENMYPTLPTAVAAYEHRYPEEADPAS